METNLRLHGVLIGGKGSTLYNNFVLPLRWTVKRNHHQVKVYGQRIHHHNFEWLRSYQFRGLFSKELVVGHPWVPCLEMALHAKLSPVLQFLVNVGCSRLGLQAERVTTQIYARACSLRQQETLAIALQRIAFIHRDRKILTRLKLWSTLEGGHCLISSGVRSRRISRSALSQSISSTRLMDSQSSANIRS